MLTIAGSDSGGGAGIQADLRTFNAFALHATTAVTAVTAQNTLGVDAVATIDPDMVVAQVRSVVGDFELSAVKTRMLASPVTIERVAGLAREGLLPHLVVDPVLVSSSGHALMSDGGVEAYRDSLLAYAEVVTPNLREASLLCDVDVDNIKSHDDMIALAHALLDFGPAFVLVKGGHYAQATPTETRAPDVLVGGATSSSSTPRASTPVTTTAPGATSARSPPVSRSTAPFPTPRVTPNPSCRRADERRELETRFGPRSDRSPGMDE